MSDLSMFFAENAVKEENVKYAASKRFLTKDKKAVEWELCCISSKEDEDIRRSCTKKVPVPGRKGQYNSETDGNLYLGKLAARCVVFPNLNDVALQNSYGVMGADNLLKAMLKSGEYSDLIIKVQEINGFDTDMDEQVEEAKN
ncbi:phage tail assembly chaperone [Anaerocolumna jejuensis]|uniref:phage tail assembly chaperone n=1 Tax=Anaerocolumna jejuensis TaxID=259063 RepID=UPI003F7C47F5